MQVALLGALQTGSQPYQVFKHGGQLINRVCSPSTVQFLQRSGVGDGVGVQVCKRTPKGFDLSKIRTKSLKIMAKIPENGQNSWHSEQKWRPTCCLIWRNGTQRLQKNTKSHEDLYFWRSYQKKVFMIFVGENSRTKLFGQKSFAPPKIWLLLHLCSNMTTVAHAQGRTQGGGFGVKPPLELDILRKLCYLRKGD